MPDLSTDTAVVTAVDFAAMKKELTSLRKDLLQVTILRHSAGLTLALLQAFKTDLISAKQEIMAALKK